MKQFTENMKRNEIITGTIFVVLGLILVIWPGTSVQIVCRGIGVLLLVYGLIQVITYLRDKEKSLAAQGMFAIGIIAVALGVWITLKPGTIIAALPVIAGILIALHGVQNIIQAMTLKKQGYQYWWAAVIIGITTVIFGIVLFCNPFTAVEVLIRIIGIFMMCDGGSNVWIQSRISTGN